MTPFGQSVYLPGPAEGHELCHPIQSEDFETINVHVNGLPQRHLWQPLAMRLVKRDGIVDLLESDAPWLGAHAMVLRPKAMDVVGRMLSDSYEFLPLDCAQATLSVLNPPLVDALDEATSSVVRFSGGRIMAISRHSFRPDMLRARHAFKIPNLRVSPTFVSSEFVTRWNDAGLTGLTFTRLWPQ